MLHMGLFNYLYIIYIWILESSTGKIYFLFVLSILLKIYYEGRDGSSKVS
jgi:hypothetical protein